MENTTNNTTSTANKVEESKPSNNNTNSNKGQTMNNTENKLKEQEAKDDFLSLLTGIDAENLEREDFVKHEITALVTSYSRRMDEKTKIYNKVQLQTRMLNPETAELIDETFSLRSDNEITEEQIKALLKKVVFVTDIKEYVNTDKDSYGKVFIKSRTYGGKWENLKVIESKEIYKRNAYVEIQIDGVSDVMSKGKTTGEVNLISLKHNEDGSIQTFQCKLTLPTKLSRVQFTGVIGKKFRINDLNIFVSKTNEKFYSTKSQPQPIK